MIFTRVKAGVKAAVAYARSFSHYNVCPRALAGGVFLFFGLGFALVLMLRAGQADYWVVRTVEVRGNIDQLDELLLASNSTQRGYLITGNPVYLQRYQQVTAEIPHSENTLLGLTADNPAQQGRIAELSALIAAKLSELDRGAALMKQGHQEAAFDVVRSDEALDLMRDIRTRIAALDRLEAGTLVRRQSAAFWRWTQQVVGVSVMLILALLLVASSARRTSKALRAMNLDLARQVEERTRQALQAQKLEMLGQITGGIAHDFNNVLMAVASNIAGLKSFTAQHVQARKYLDTAMLGVERGTTLTSRLLVFARHTTLKPETIDVCALLSTMMDLIASSVGGGIRLETRFRPQLRPVCADANQVEMALLNLCVNARDAMPDGGTLTLQVEERVAHDAGPAPCAGRYICISVTDTGTGMDETTLARAMEPFFTTKGSAKGTGLGLAMVHGLAVQSGGRLVLKSSLGAGTTAELWLPQADAGAAVAAPAQDMTPAQTRRLHVLLVDDDGLVLMGTQAMLERMGHQVTASRCGAHALELLRRDAGFDLLITDYAMPEMNGTQLASGARQIKPALPVLLVTGYAELPETEDQGMTGLSKPFDPVQFSRAINRAVSLSATAE